MNDALKLVKDTGFFKYAELHDGVILVTNSTNGEQCACIIPLHGLDNIDSPVERDKLIMRRALNAKNRLDAA